MELKIGDIFEIVKPFDLLGKEWINGWFHIISISNTYGYFNAVTVEISKSPSNQSFSFYFTKYVLDDALEDGCIKLIKESQPKLACECGKEKHGFTSHTRWCPVNKE